MAVTFGAVRSIWLARKIVDSSKPMIFAVNQVSATRTITIEWPRLWQRHHGRYLSLLPLCRFSSVLCGRFGMQIYWLIETHHICIESGADYRNHCESASKPLAAMLQQILAASAAMWVVIRAARSIWLVELLILLTTYSFCNAHMTLFVTPKKFK